MLELLQIRNLAIISDLSIEFQAGLNIITGETGGGKSILLDALGLILGERAQSEVVRTGADRAELQAIFDVRDDRRVGTYLEEAGVEPPGDGQLVIRREILRQGKSRCQVNGQWVTVQALAGLGDLLVDFHGQHQHQSLLRSDEQLLLLDAFAGGHAGKMDAYQEAWRRHRDLRREWEALNRNDREQARRLDMLRFELEEIRAARLEPGEFDQLQTELRRLANAEKLIRRAGEAYTLLYEGEAESASVSTLLGQIEQALEDLAEMDDTAAPLREAIAGARVALEEAAFGLRDYAAGIQADPDRLAEVQERAELIKKLRRKYGESEEEILELAARHERELDEAGHDEERRDRVNRDLEEAKRDLERAAQELRKARESAAARLARAVEKELQILNMKGAKLTVAFEPHAEFTSTGGESVEFLLAANVGEEPRPLRRVASGGELSRIMLAIKSVDAQKRHLPTMVFDEIDAGVGGVTADRVGEKLNSLAARRQIVCITHLPQIAARGVRHLHVTKRTQKGRTESRVVPLEGEDRLAELARMIGGEKAGPESHATARVLLEAAPAKKR